MRPCPPPPFFAAAGPFGAACLRGDQHFIDYGTTSAEDIATYGPTFAEAVDFWQSHLTGYRDGALAPSAVTIAVTLENIDGLGGTLGSAGPSTVDIQGSFMEPVTGGMTFDTSTSDRCCPRIVLTMSSATKWGTSSIWQLVEQ